MAPASVAQRLCRCGKQAWVLRRTAVAGQVSKGCHAEVRQGRSSMLDLEAPSEHATLSEHASPAPKFKTLGCSRHCEWPKRSKLSFTELGDVPSVVQPFSARRHFCCVRGTHVHHDGFTLQNPSLQRSPQIEEAMDSLVQQLEEAPLQRELSETLTSKRSYTYGQVWTAQLSSGAAKDPSEPSCGCFDRA